jgi:hypothetical protein
MKLVNALGFAGHDQGHLALWVLCGDAGGAITGVASLGLNASQGKHETARTVAPVCTQG